MRKDFLVDPYQVIEARAHGAGGVLLIARMLDATRLKEMLDTAASLALFALLESFDLRDLDRAVRALEHARGTVVLGVNARDLETLTIDAARHAALAPHAPRGSRLVAESGIATREDAARVASAGYSAALVGEALMLAPDPALALTMLIASGREAAPRREVMR
jgi:indole-3-glycerol phosphate synthase